MTTHPKYPGRVHAPDVDQFARLNMGAFAEAMSSLGRMCPVMTSGLSQLWEVYRRGLESGGLPSEGFLYGLPTSASIPLMVAYFHLAEGAPLYLDERIYALWCLSEGGHRQCPACGYRVPSALLTCPLCKVEAGEPGCWAAGAASMALVN